MIHTNPKEARAMTDPTTPTPPDQPGADETFTWSDPPGPGHRGDSGRSGSTATGILESVRDAVDELAERAAPSVRELSARAAELTAIAADRAAPLAKRAGELTADASGKLASKSREWAADLRASVTTAEHPSDDAPTSPAPTGGFDPAERPGEPPELHQD
jgi:hypothetical protein